MIHTTGHESIAKLLIENGANVNAVNKNNNSALISAALNGNMKRASIVFIHFLKTIYKTPSVCSKLINRIIQWHTGHESVVELLVENAVDLNILNKYNNTALMLAIFKGFDTA